MARRYLKRLPVAAAAEMKRRFDLGEDIESLSAAYKVSPRTVARQCAEKEVVQSSGIEQSYRANINWALSAAGEFSRTGIEPKTCPNDAAWFLYQQAIDDPKDFMAKVSAVEKSAESEDGKEDKKSTKKTLSEIESFLERLEENGQDEVRKQDEEKEAHKNSYGDDYLVRQSTLPKAAWKNVRKD